MRLYTDLAALAAYPGGDTVASEDQAALIRTASQMVEHLTIGRAYVTDTAGMPTDPDVQQALSDACCAIVVELSATGATKAGASLQWDSVGIGSVSLSGRKVTEGTVTVRGLPVPAAALLALGALGPVQVNGSGRYGRPLDRVATERVTETYKLVQVEP